MTAGELLELLRFVDPEALVVVDDLAALPCHAQVTVQEFTVTFSPGEFVTEEDLA